jgi:hypothetical protein
VLIRKGCQHSRFDEVLQVYPVAFRNPVLGLDVRIGFTVRGGSIEPDDRSRLNGRYIIGVVARAPTTRLSNAYAYDLNIRGRVRPLGGLLRQEVAGR